MKIWAIPGLFYIFVFSMQLLEIIFKICLRLDSNRGPLVVEATTLPTELLLLPQPTDKLIVFLLPHTMNGAGRYLNRYLSDAISHL